MKLALTFVLFSSVAMGQTLMIGAGTSTLFGGTGAGVTAYFPNNTVSLSGGISQGHPTIGLLDTFKWRDGIVNVGTQTFNGSVEGGGLTLQGVGLSFLRGDENKSMAGFVGSSGIGYTTPYYAGNVPQHIGAAFYLQRKLSLHWKIGTLTAVDASHKTFVQSGAYTKGTWRITGAGGILNNSRYVTGTGEWSPIRSLHFSASHQDSFDVIDRIVIHSKSDSAAAFATVSRFTANAVIIHSDGNGKAVIGFSAGVGTHIGPVDLRTDVYHSGQYQTVNYTARENIGRHFYASETVSQSKTTSTSFGGGYRSNNLSLSVDHSVVFIPFNLGSGAGFQQVTSVSFMFRVKDALINLVGYIPSVGKAKYTAYGNDYQQGPMTGVPRSHEVHAASGKFIVSGVVHDAKTGDVVEGVAVQIGKQLIFSNAAGVLLTHVKKQRAVTVRVSPDDYALAGNVKVVSAPETVTPALEGHEANFTVVVELF